MTTTVWLSSLSATAACVPEDQPLIMATSRWIMSSSDIVDESRGWPRQQVAAHAAMLRAVFAFIVINDWMKVSDFQENLLEQTINPR